MNPFDALGLRPELLSALTSLGYEEPTPIQAAAIPALISGSDLLGQAATGTGKTAAFALPMLQTLNGKRGDGPSGLVLVPTRELALQVAQALHSYGRTVGVRLVAVYGGAPVRQQIDALRRGVDIVVATPGRALDLAGRGSLKLGGVRTVVLDEADEMLDMGFVEDIESILALTPSSRQTVLFSATLPARIDALARKYLRNPERIAIAPDKPTSGQAPKVRQTAYVVARATKAAALQRVLDVEDPQAAIVFCRTRGGVDELTDVLTSRGYQAEALHGGLTQDQRDRVMGRLRSGATDLLVATDVAARGLDVDQLSHVFNYDLPVSPEAYVHRIGRVGRAGREGVAVSLVEPRERRLLSAIERLLGGPIPTGRIPTVADVRHMRLQRTRTDIEEMLADEDAVVRMEAYRDIVEEMLQDRDPVDVVLASFAAAHEATQGSGVEDVEIETVDPRAGRDAKAGKAGKADKWSADKWSKGDKRDKFSKGDKRDKFSKGDRGGGDSRGGPDTERRPRRLTVPTQRLFVSLGRQAGVTPGDLVGALTGETSLKGKDIGIVTVHEVYSLVEVPADKARKVARDLQHCTIRGHRAKVRLDRE